MSVEWEGRFLPVYAQGNIGKWFDLAKLTKGFGMGLSWQRACIVLSLSGAGVDTEHLVLLHLSATGKSSRTLWISHYHVSTLVREAMAGVGFWRHSILKCGNLAAQFTSSGMVRCGSELERCKGQANQKGSWRGSHRTSSTYKGKQPAYWGRVGQWQQYDVSGPREEIICNMKSF